MVDVKAFVGSCKFSDPSLPLEATSYSLHIVTCVLGVSFPCCHLHVVSFVHIHQAHLFI